MRRQVIRRLVSAFAVAAVCAVVAPNGADRAVAAGGCQITGQALGGVLSDSGALLFIAYDGTTTCTSDVPVQSMSTISMLQLDGHTISSGPMSTCSCDTTDSSGEYDQPQVGTTYVFVVDSTITLQSGFVWTSFGQGCSASGATLTCQLRATFTYPIGSVILPPTPLGLA